MQNITEHLSNTVTTTATCFKLKLKDNSIIGFTDFDQDILLDGITYHAKSGIERSSIETNTDLSTDNLNISGILDNPIITETDLLTGKYDGASIEIFLINYENITQGKLILKTGFLNEIKVINGKFYAEIYGLSSKLESTLGQLYSPTCRAMLGDKKCKININSYTKISIVTDIIDEISFIDKNLKEANNYYDYGTLTFITGNNKNIFNVVKSHINNIITFYYKMPYKISVGDQYKIIAGCDKNFMTCILKFKNHENFRGEPHVPNEINHI